jgi:hypothetical protein
MVLMKKLDNVYQGSYEDNEAGGYYGITTDNKAAEASEYNETRLGRWKDPATTSRSCI